MAEEDAQEMIDEADQNGDGKIDYKGIVWLRLKWGLIKLTKKSFYFLDQIWNI